VRDPFLAQTQAKRHCGEGAFWNRKQFIGKKILDMCIALKDAWCLSATNGVYVSGTGLCH